jgi:hypothetical protein
MNAHWPEPDRRELLAAGAAGIIWALLGMSLMARGADLNPPPSKGGVRGGTPHAIIHLCGGVFSDAAVANPSPVPSLQGRGAVASCRITNHLPNGVIDVGSGTLIDVSADRQRGLVLTCAHLFTEGTGTVVVEFPGQPTHGANLLAIDRNADLAALAIARPPVAPSSVALNIDSATQLTACGFGANGQFRAVAGPIVGAAQSQGQVSLQLRGAVRSGDSGGGVFDSAGRLAAVVWGESGGVTYASTGAPLRSFLERVVGRGAPSSPGIALQPATSLAACPNGRCPLIGPSALYPSPSAPSARPFPGGSLFGNPASTPSASAPLQTPAAIAADGKCTCGCDKEYAALATRLDALDRAKQDRGDYLPPTALNDYARTDQLTELAVEGRTRHDALLERIEQLGPLLATAGRAAAPIAISALGVSGPAGWGILAAASFGSWLLGRRIKARGAGRETRVGESRKLAPRASQLAPTPPEATAAADEGFQCATSSHPNAIITHIETRAPIERDDREARELLRLSQLEGRDPLQDALAGRLALDRLDALAESDADPTRARLADDLRRELRERFNEIAPTKFEV